MISTAGRPVCQQDFGNSGISAFSQKWPRGFPVFFRVSHKFFPHFRPGSRTGTKTTSEAAIIDKAVLPSLFLYSVKKELYIKHHTADQKFPERGARTSRSNL
jgi:hypothetical protein